MPVLLHDGDTQYISICLRLENSDATLTEALERITPDIQDICLCVVQGGWPLLCRHLATRENLRNIRLCFSDIRGSVNPPETDIRPYLEAAQQNNAIRFVELENLRLCPVAVASFLDASAQLEEFSLKECTMVRNETEGPAVLATALQRHANLKHLQLKSSHGVYVTAILDALRMNRALEKVTVRGFHSWSGDILQSFQKLMRSTRSLRELKIYHTRRWNTKEDMLEIANANFSLRTFTVDPAFDFFNQDDQRVLRSYFDRNERVEQFIENPVSIPRCPYPETFATIAHSNNPSVLFESFRAASTELFGGNQQRGRKRRRPAYYKPT